MKRDLHEYVLVTASFILVAWGAPTDVRAVVGFLYFITWQLISIKQILEGKKS